MTDSKLDGSNFMRGSLAYSVYVYMSLGLGKMIQYVTRIHSEDFTDTIRHKTKINKGDNTYG